MIAVARPSTGDYNPMFQRYVDRVNDADVLDAMARQVDDVSKVFTAVAPAKEQFRYADGKWSVRQVLGHLVDSERVFGYRMLCLARGEQQSLPGYEENEYAANAGHDAVPLADLLEPFALLRRSNVLLAREFDEAAWARVGTANANRTTVRALPYIMVGHARHHLAVLADKYGLTG